MIYKFRVILDTEDDVLRDIAIKDTDTLEDLHNAIFNSFGFDGMEGGSFFTCNDQWEQEDEIPLFDLGDTPGECRTMADFQIKDVLHEEKTKIIYVYDPFVNWTFFVELGAIESEEETEEKELPTVLFTHGVLPNQVETKNYESAGDDTDDDKHSLFDDDIFDGDDSFEDYYDDYDY